MDDSWGGFDCDEPNGYLCDGPAPAGCTAAETFTAGAVERTLCDDQLTRDEAEAQCATVGGHLSRVDNFDDNNVMFTTIGAPSRRVWIGATDRLINGVWLWEDGELLDDLRAFTTP